ncbi:MAG TPA: hypothetical protein GX013_06665 [Propionibacterium sp.]|nr:hypothetical protein [Propionibacterium sp.]
MIPWTPIPPDAPLKDLWGQSFFADAGDGRAMLLTVSISPVAARPAAGEPRPDERLRVTSHASFGWRRRRNELLPDYLPISGACIPHGMVPRRVVTVPALEWPAHGAPRIRTEGRMLTFRDLVQHGPPASVRLQGALAMADEVKTTYGRMLADVAYRIEQSALFDSAVPTTRSFDNALRVWDELDHSSAGEEDVVRLAGTLKLAFQTARAHAEALGLDHLPVASRADARRAASAARLAVWAKTDGERAAAQEQVVRILRSLALYYLPDPDHVPLQLTR